MHRVAILLSLATAVTACGVSHSHVSSMTPENGSTVDEAPAQIDVAFDRPMNPATITSATFRVEGTTTGPAEGSFAYDEVTYTASFTPDRSFEPGETVTVNLTDDIESTSDKKLRTFVGSFTVRPPAQPDPLEVISIDPAPETVGIDDRPTIRVRFNTTYNPFTVTEDTVLVTGSRSGAIQPSFPNVFLGIDELTVQLDRPLIAGERLTIRLGGGLSSTEGAVLPETRIGYTVATTAGTETPTSVANGLLPTSEGRLHFFDADGDGRDEWVVVAPSGRIEAQELIADTPSTIEVQQLSEGVIDSVVGDFDGDGRSDLVCLGASGDQIHVLLGSNLGSRILDLAFRGDLDLSANGLVAAAIDFDAAHDLLIIPTDPAAPARVAFGAAPTPFLESADSAVAITAPAALADFDGDGLVDLVHVDGSGGVSWSRGVGAGHFADTTSITAAAVVALTVASLDGDERPDVVGAGSGANPGLTLLANSGATFTREDLPPESAAEGSAIVDFDGDGVIDSLSPRAGSVDAVIWSGLVSETGAVSLVEEPVTLAFGDIDGDGVVDLGAISVTGRWDVFGSDPLVPPVTDRVFATDVTAASGSVNEPFEIRADHAEALDGFTVALSYDPSLVTLERVSTVGSDSELTGVELEMPNLDPIGGTAVIAVVFDFLPPFDGQQLGAGTDQRLLTGELSLAPGVAAQTTSLVVGTGIGSPPNDTAFVVAGFTVDPALENGTITIEDGGAPQPPPTTFLRGDVNDDGFHDIADANFLSAYLFQGGAAPNCLDAADVNDDGFVDTADTTYLVDYLLTGGAPPPAPFPSAGVDPTSDGLSCDAPS